MKMKKIIITLLVIAIALSCVVGAVACKKTDKVIDTLKAIFSD